MDFRLLGPLEVFAGPAPLPIAAGKQRALLAVLLLDANRSVSRDQIVDALWGERAPGTAPKMVQILVSQLRKALPESRVQRARPATCSRCDGRAGPGPVRAFGRRRPAGARGGPSREARGLLGRALALWRGPALAEFSEPFAMHEGARFEELRLAALEWRIEADLALGHHRDLVSELETLIAQ